MSDSTTRDSAATCHHCGKPDEADGDHSCDCPMADHECLDHPILCPPCHALQGDRNYFVCPQRDDVRRTCQWCKRVTFCYLCRGHNAA